MMEWVFAFGVAVGFIGAPWLLVWRLEPYLRRRASRRLMANIKRDLERMADEIGRALLPALRECIEALARFAAAWSRGEVDG